MSGSDLALVQCKVTGAGHVRAGKPCQDAIRGVREGAIVALAVADGHGTSAHGDVGAALAVEVAIEQLLEFARGLDSGHIVDTRTVHAYAKDRLRCQLVRAWTARVREHAGSETAALQPYGSTLLVALASPSYLLVGQLGDGDILLVGAGGRVARPMATDPRHFAEETTSLCQSDAWTAMRVHVAPAPDAEALLVLSTDGYSKSYATDAIFELIGPDYLDMLREHGADGVEARLPEVLEQVTTGGSGDDIALGILHWAPAAHAGAEMSTAAPATPGKENDACVDS
jgi:Protein phosphatase 2C